MGKAAPVSPTIELFHLRSLVKKYIVKFQHSSLTWSPVQQRFSVKGQLVNILGFAGLIGLCLFFVLFLFILLFPFSPPLKKYKNHFYIEGCPGTGQRLGCRLFFEDCLPVLSS